MILVGFRTCYLAKQLSLRMMRIDRGQAKVVGNRSMNNCDQGGGNHQNGDGGAGSESAMENPIYIVLVSRRAAIVDSSKKPCEPCNVSAEEPSRLFCRERGTPHVMVN